MSQLQAMLLSLLIEVPLAIGIVALLRWLPRAELKRLAVVAVAATLLSHPLAWAAGTWLQPRLGYVVMALIVETGVVALEAVLYARLAGLGWWRGAALAVLANGASFGVGLLVFYALG